MEKQCSRPRVLRIETVQGDPYSIAGRELIPIARVVSFGKASATIGANQVGGQGGGFVSIKPVAVWVRTPAGERRISLQDGSATAVRDMLAIAIAATLFFSAIRWLARRMRRLAIR